MPKLLHSRKRCARCLLTKDRIEFHASRRNSDGLQSYCRTCCALYSSKHYRDNLEQNRLQSRERNRHPEVRRRMLECKWMRQYGITLREWNVMFTVQDGRCAICCRQFAEDLQPKVDHCHATGRVRGLLCDQCNIAAGVLRDDPIRARALALYLERAGGVVTSHA